MKVESLVYPYQSLNARTFLNKQFNHCFQMMGRFWSVCVVLSTLGMVGFSLTPSSFLSTVDKQRLQKVFADSLATENANR